MRMTPGKGYPVLVTYALVGRSIENRHTSKCLDTHNRYERTSESKSETVTVGLRNNHSVIAHPVGEKPSDQGCLGFTDQPPVLTTGS